MSGFQGKGDEPWDKYASQRLEAIKSNNHNNGTGQYRAMPRRPPNLQRVTQPPTTPRVARPQRRPTRQTNWRRRFLIWGVVLVVCGLFACGISYAAVNYFAGINASAASAVAATDFLSAVSAKNYHQAYNDLAAPITVQMTETNFTETAKLEDQCDGPITHFTEVAGSAVTQNNSQSYTYTITRAKLSHTYAMQLTLQQDAFGNWKVSSYGDNNDLGPTCDNS
jgi:hypothetical protein